MKKFFTTLALVLVAATSLQAQYITSKIHPLPDELTFAGEKVPINLPYVREAIDREVLTTCSMHTSTTLALRLSGRYFPIIEPILQEYGVPNDFKYLCVAESGLNVNAKSPAGAAGLWQFMKSAAKEYGLETGDNTDLRYHVEKSTRAACRYLKNAYRRFGSWTLAAASYNAGQAGVATRMDRQMVENYWDVYLPEETMRYVPRILSFKILMEAPASHGFAVMKSQYFAPFKNYTNVVIDDEQIDWSKFAKEHGTNYRQLRILNPWIRSYEYTNRARTKYTIMVPNSDFVELGY